VIQLAGVHDPAAAAKLIGKTAVLQFYDFEADLTGPSVTTGLQKVPVATGSLFGLLTRRRRGRSPTGARPRSGTCSIRRRS